MNGKTTSQPTHRLSGPDCISIVFQAVAVLGISSFFFYNGVRDMSRREAVITHKHAPSEHVTGDRAVNEGIRELLLGAVVLGIGGFRLLTRVSNALSGPVPKATSASPPGEPNPAGEPTEPT